MLTEAEEAQRDREERAHKERLAREVEEAAKPKPPTLEERVAELERKLAAR